MPSPQPDATRLITWPAAEFDPTATDCFNLDDQIWIWQPEVGAVRFNLQEPLLHASLWPGADPDWFRQIVTRSWLPAVYPLWGRQVLHASAVMRETSGDTVAFTGPTHAGKSTTAYGLSRRLGWRRLCDDTLAFSTAALGRGEPSGHSTAIRLHPLPQDVRLRPESASHYGVADQPEEPLEWPELAPALRTVFVLDGDASFDGPPRFTRLPAAEALPILLRQAYALSFGIPKYNQALMRDYLALAAGVPVFRLQYRRSFDVADELFTSIEDHLRF